MRSTTRAALIGLAALVLMGAAPAAGAPILMWDVSYGHDAGYHDYSKRLVTAGNDIYVAATSQASQHPDDFTVLRYRQNGKLVWDLHLGGAAEEFIGEPSDLVVVDRGVIVVGYGAVDGSWTITTARISRKGKVSWIRHDVLGERLAIDGPKVAVALDGSLRVAVGDKSGFRTIALTADGDLLWSTAADVSAGDDVATDVAVDPAGNAYVVGSHDGGYSTVKIDSSGNVRWTVDTPGPIGNALGPAWVEISPDGLPVVAAVPETTCGLHQARVWKFVSDGEVEWETAYPDDPCAVMEPVDMAIRADGSVVVLARSNAVNPDITTISLGVDGSVEWVRSIEDGTTDLPSALTLDASGRAYVTGVHAIGLPPNDAMTASYARDGRRRWRGMIDVGSQSERPSDIALLPDRSVLVLADYYTAETFEELLLVRYRQPPDVISVQPWRESRARS